MRRVGIKELTPGMRIAEDIYAYNNLLVLSKGLILTDLSITKLEYYSILNVKIEDEYMDDVRVSDEDISYSEKLKSSATFKEFQSQFNASIDTLHTLLDDVTKFAKPLHTADLLGSMASLLECNSADSKINVFDMLHNMRDYDDLTYAHSLNVALICNVFARWLHFSEENIETATMCGLLHDIGKLLIPDSIIKKPDKLTNQEYEIVKTHPVKGYQLLQQFEINEHIQNAVLMHHERCDGHGYPFGLIDQQIDKFAKMVSIADVYDAMTSARVYRGSLCPFKVIELFESEGFQKYDVEYVLTFLECIANTYLHYRVQLSNGICGDIIFINKERLSKPIVQADKKFVDLSEFPDLHIEYFV